MLRFSGRLRRALAASAAAVLVMLASPAFAGSLKSVSVAGGTAGTSVEFTISGSIGQPTAFALDGPRRLVIDIPGASTTAVTVAGGGPIEKARAAQFDATITRVVLDLAEPAKIAASSSAAGKVALTVVAVDAAEFTSLVGRGRTKFGAPIEPKPAAAPPTPVSKPVVAAAQPAAEKMSPKVQPAAPPPTRIAAAPPEPRAPAARTRTRTGLPVVVIDAGHGGKDVGTISVLGPRRYEKDAVLAVAKAIKKELDASGRVRAVLTRGDDTYLRHRDRFELARRNRAELFISVHADSAPVPTASGATVYTLSETASDVEAARLAAKENRSDVIAGVDLGTESGEVSDILIDLAQRETMNTSAEFAAALQRELRQDIKVRSQFHRFAGFLVLKAPDVPSVLLETGYLSNEEDSRFLFSPEGQRRIAKGVRRAVEAHFLRRLAQR